MARSAVRVFISSTFRDMHAERDHLVTVVFPELRQRLERLGLELFDVDLRWGVPEEGGDGEKANPWIYCKRWIERVEPFFIAILGQRYGWKPPSEEIVDPQDRERYRGLSITEMEIRHALLEGDLKRRSFVYLRDARVPPDAPPEIAAEFVDPEDAERLRQLESRLEASDRPVRRYPARWTGEGFADLEAFGEMVLEDLWAGVLRDERFVPAAAWSAALDVEPSVDPLYADEARPVPPELWREIVEAARPAPVDPLDAESSEMAGFASARLRWFRGRERELEAIEGFVRDDPNPGASRLCAVVAAPGQGKTALLAKVEERLTTGDDMVITHYVGSTDRSADLRWLLGRLVSELERAGVGGPRRELVRDVEGLRVELAGRLEAHEGPRRCVVLVDAVNQLDAGHDLGWVPRRLGPAVRFVVSSIEDPVAPPGSPPARVLEALAAREPAPVRVAVPPLASSDVRAIVVEYLEEYSKVLDERDIDRICDHEHAGNPLYLLVMLNELRALGGNDMQRIVPKLLANLRRDRPDVESLFDWVIERLEVFGREEVRSWFSYLALGRAGMASRELAELLEAEAGEKASRAGSRVERSVRRYLEPRGGQLDFFHGQMRMAAERRYLKDPKDRAARHRTIAGYFRGRAAPGAEGMWEEGDARALSELPHHLTESARLDPSAWPELYATLSDFGFLEAKVASVGVFDVQEDLARAVALASGGGAERRKVLVTPVDLGRGLEIRCPHCHRVTAYDAGWAGREATCPNPECLGPWSVTPFVATSPIGEGRGVKVAAYQRTDEHDLLKLPPP